MNAEEQNAERVLKLLLETFPEHPRSESGASPIPPEPSGGTAEPLLMALGGDTPDHGIRELNSPLSE
jgi:hypothetical protein